MIKQLNRLIDKRLKENVPNIQLKKLIKKRNNTILVIDLTNIITQ